MLYEDKKEKIEVSFPVIPLRNIVVFPQMVAPILITGSMSVKAIEQAINGEMNDIILLAQKDPMLEIPDKEDLYRVGVLAKVIQILKFPDGSIKAIVEGICRAKIKKIKEEQSIFTASIYKIKEVNHTDDNTRALLRITIDRFETYVKRNNRMSSENLLALSSLNNDPGRMADIIATYLELDLKEKQKIIELKDTTRRLELMSNILERELEMLAIEESINKKLKQTLNKAQKEFYLKEKLKIINDELNAEQGLEDENEIYKTRIANLEIQDKYKKKLTKEVDRIQRMPSYSTEVAVLKSYLDRVIELPWNEKTEDVNDIDRAQAILDEDHWGLKDVKERIIEFLAVRQLSENRPPSILCLVGPPGVGKSSLAKSIARSLDRKFSYISLGGINDESEIRGHRKTYVASMPGRIIQAIESSGTNNPVILLDEIDKMMRSHMGDPTAALLEVLDPEQNKTFTDHYVDIPFDLSDVFFIATANTLDTIYKALKDRLEVIRLSGYTEEEKANIAKYFLLPKQMKLHGVKKTKLKISDIALQKIINEYTKEAGVRNLEREIAKINRKVATEIIREIESRVSISNKNIEKFLGIPKYISADRRSKSEIGIINGLAWTEVGGDILYIESGLMPGKGKLNLTGSLGEVMRESAKIAISYIRSNSEKYNLPDDLSEKYDIHIHVPDGATPKDGPSAGLAITLSVISSVTRLPVRADVALTGEVTVRGKVLPIGGVKEKVLAAIRNEVYTLILPVKNRKDIEELPEYINEKVEYIYVDNIDEAARVIFAS